MKFSPVGFKTLFFIFLSCTIFQCSQAQTFKKAQESLYKLSDAKQMDSTFQVIYKQYSKQKNTSSKDWDAMKGYVAMGYVYPNDTTKINQYLHRISNDTTKGFYYYSIARTYSTIRKKDLAIHYAQIAYNRSLDLIARNITAGSNGMEPQSVLASSTALLSDLYTEKGELDSAIHIVENGIYKCTTHNQFSLSITLAKLYFKKKDYKHSFDLFKAIVAKGNKSEDVMNSMRQNYEALYPNATTSFDSYIAQYKEELLTEEIDSLQHSSIRIKAPNFTLKNRQGQEVSLQSLKGKVVILDFWATWCTPCKASFPAMKKAMQALQDQKNVVFLFIDTWENGKDFKLAVEDFLTRNDYPFNVLYDEANPKTGKCDVVESFGVKGIPSKFIIDPNGFIRFSVTGFGGDDESVVKEISAMVKLVNK